MVKVKRVYEKPSKDDGKRILVDRLWPRGLSIEAAAIDDWLKEIAPSNELRKWFGHDPARWPEFRKRYRAEIVSNQGLIEKLRVESRKGTVTLLYAARDMERNNAVVLKEMFD